MRERERESERARERESERERERKRERESERERERERKRERESERERERERDRIQKSGKQITPTIFPFVDSGPISLGFSRESPRTARAMWCFVAYVYNEREREGEREIERERERERERDGESTLQDHIITMRWELHYIRVYPTIFSCVDPRYQLSRFFTGISRRNNEELISLIGINEFGIFPPKSEILFVLSLALIWYRNFQDRTIPLGGDTWPCFWRKEGIIKTIRTRETHAS